MECFQVQNKGTIKSCPSRASVVEERPEASGLLRHLLPRPLPPALVVQLLGEPLLPVVCHTTRMDWFGTRHADKGRSRMGQVPRLRSKRPPWRPGCRVSPPLTYLVVHLVVVLKVSFLPKQDVDVDVRHGLARLGTVLDAERERVSGFHDREASGKRSCALDPSPWPTTFVWRVFIHIIFFVDGATATGNVDTEGA